MVKVKQFRSLTSGRNIPNQFIITDKDRTIFQSYDSIIAIKWNDGDIFLDKTYWDYSKTTGKYRNQFLGEDIKTTRKKIKSGEYRLADLKNYAMLIIRR